jgi:uncharacterized protein (TIGR02246 family)
VIHIMKAQRTLAALGMLLAGTCAATAAQDEPKKADNPPADRRAAPDRAADERAIREAGAAFVRAYNAGDARAIAALFTEDAEVIDEDGHPIQGRAAIAELFASTFAAHPGETIEVTIDSIRFLGPDSAKEEGHDRIVPAKDEDKGKKKVPTQGGVPQHSRYTVLYVRQSGRWLQSSVREQPDREVTPHERLEPLSWMVGDWVDEGGSSVVFSSTRWSDDGSSLIRDFTIQVRGKPSVRGTQRIGWDPLRKQIASWAFDSEGDHAEGLWAHDGRNNRWVVKSSGVLRDGRTATATQVYTVVSPDLVRWKSVDRTVGDRVEPDVDELMMVRKPPRPR